MHRGSPSPIFDVPEFPALRRVKPLPKRRRTTVGVDNENGLSMSSTPSEIPIPGLPFFEQLAQQVVQQGFLTGHSASLEELVGESDELMGSLSLQDYYLPSLGDTRRFMASSAGDDADGVDGNRSSNTAAAAAAAAISAVTGAGRNGQVPLPMSHLESLEFGMHFAAAAAAAAAAGVAMGGLGSLGLGLAGMSLGNEGTDANGTNTDAGLFAGMSGSGRSRDEDDARSDGDYMDHLRQPGNTKKRKVPANMSPRSGGLEGSARPGSPSSGYMEEEGGDLALEGGGGRSLEDDNLQLQYQRERDRERDRDRERSHSPNLRSHMSSPTNPYPPAPFPGQVAMVARKRGKLMAVTLAGLQHKELLKSRKRQLAAVMGALSHGDTLALDQALTGATYGYRGYGSGVGKANLITGPGDDAHAQARAQGMAVRKSKRRTVRLARAMKIVLAMPERRIRHPDAVPFPSSDFEFSCPSGTADRLIATKEEVASLRKRFEVELEKQAAKAAKMAVAAATGHGGAGGNAGGPGGDRTRKPAKATGGKGKRERQERDRERAERAQAQMQAQAMKAKDQNVVNTSVTTVTPTMNPAAPPSGVGDFGMPTTGPASGGGGKPKGKKKKRSTLANASNPHHLKNYVPSRLPHSGDGGHAGAMGNYGGISPLPVRFLSAQIPPMRKRGQGRRDKENLAEGGTPPRGTPTSQPGHHGGLPSSVIPLKHPAEEWICAFCEYDLFYGSEAAYRKAVRNRKKILKRRRRARERAAKAASGKLGAAAHQPPAPPPSEEGDEDEDDLYEEEVVDGQGNGNGEGLKAGRWKGGRGPDG